MLYLHGIGHFHPTNVIDNDFLESLDIGANAEWTMQRVGIRERHTVLSLDYVAHTRNRDPREANGASQFTNPQTAARAARLALSCAKLEPSDIGMVISGGCSPQFCIPSEACMVAAELDIDAPAFDLHSACSSFALQLHFLNSMQPSALPDFVLLVNAENTTRTIDYSDRSTAVLWGDGTVATIVSAKVPSSAAIKLSTYGSAPAGWNKVTIPAAGHFRQDGSAVQAFAIKRTVEMFKDLNQPNTAERGEPFFIGHQANRRMLQAVCDRLHIPDERHLFNVDRFGNCGAAGAPSVLSEHWATFKSGDDIVLAAVGSGLAWGGALLQFS